MAVFVVNRSVLGDGYEMPMVAKLEAVRLVACSEKLLLDPDYCEKASVGLLAMIRAIPRDLGRRADWPGASQAN
ncbi:hypothetical protein [Lichenicola sp.]|uniref:hypothetical protein n=1 Tax=Lichenicola sp. TaxID=2804529 RepID=UPI003AFFC7A2